MASGAAADPVTGSDTVATAPDTGGTAAGDRGQTTVSERAVERLATRLISEVDGVGGSARRLLGMSVSDETPDRSADITARIQDGSATLVVRISVDYPRSVARTTQQLRTHLMRRVHELAGMTVDRVDVTVTALHRRKAPARSVH